jgi:polysaccharide pyruvyl transferase WcaK-like protein
VSICANWWLETKINSKIYLFIFHGGTKDDDASITGLLKSKLINPNRVEIIEYNSNPEKVLNKVNDCSAFIGMKYHSCVFAYMCEVPLLLIEYHPKCRYFADEIKLPNEAIVSLEEVLSNSIEKRFENFLSFPGRYIARLSLIEARKRAKKPFLEGIFYENINS